MKRFGSFVTGWAAGICTALGCASTQWPYPYYAPSMDHGCYESGVMLGKTGSDGWPDLSMKECEPDVDPSPSASPSPWPSPVKLKCLMLRVDDFYALKGDDEKCHSDLVACQHGPKPQ